MNANDHQAKNLHTIKKRIIEVLAVVLTAIGKFIFMDLLNWRFVFIASAILFWLIYVLIQKKKDKDALYRWGFRTDNFKQAMIKLLPFALISIAVCLIIGKINGTINLTWHILPLLIVYPIWGIIQQFLLISLVAGNLVDLNLSKLNNSVIILLSAGLFGLVHYPYWWLVLATFILALFYGYFFLKIRNIYALGIFHGWLGVIFFYTVVGRDPFVEVFLVGI